MISTNTHSVTVTGNEYYDEANVRRALLECVERKLSQI